jgi:hypothetical protein
MPIKLYGKRNKWQESKKFRSSNKWQNDAINGIIEV